MRHWTCWERVAYVSLFVAALIVAAETAFKTEPEVMARLPDFFHSALWGFAPAALVIFATVILQPHGTQANHRMLRIRYYSEAVQ
jgi:hypothetical protein